MSTFRRTLLLVLSISVALSAFFWALVIPLPIWARALVALACGLGAGSVVMLLPAHWKTSTVKGGAVTAVAVIGIVSALTAASTSGQGSKLPSCNDVGNSSFGVKDTTYYGAFRAAYDRAGGRRVLGCPRHDDTSGYVHKWGEGYSQDLEGQHSYPARLMVLPPSGRMILLQGALNRDYTKQFDRNSAPQVGYPTADPVTCGKTKVVPLARGIWAPSAMVTTSDSESWVWLARPFWLRYKQLGGPFGRLGRPVGQADLTDEAPNQEFEHGMLRLTLDKRAARTDREIRGLRETAPAHPFNCPGL